VLVNRPWSDPEAGSYQIGLRVLLALVSYLAIGLGAVRLLYPLTGYGDATALALSLGAILRPTYMLLRGSLDHIWYEDWCMERGFLSKYTDAPTEMDELGFLPFCGLCLVSSVLGAVMVMVLLFLLLVVAVAWLLVE
jgi:hypothetical protein